MHYPKPQPHMMILIANIFVLTAVLCLMTTSFQLGVSLIAYMLKEPLQLNALGTQLIQWAKPFQTIIWLGMYTRKVPTYNATKGLKGRMFFLPLPLQNTIEAFVGSTQRNECPKVLKCYQIQNCLFSLMVDLSSNLHYYNCHIGYLRSQ